MMGLPRLHELRLLRGTRFVAGMDETGVGTIAGPVVAAAVHLPPGGVELRTDAKSMSKGERLEAFRRLQNTPGLLWSSGAVSAAEVDRVGMRSAVELAMGLAATRMERRLLRRETGHHPLCSADAGRVMYLIDGERVPPGLDGHAMVGGDQAELSIAAASIFAYAAHASAMGALARRWPLWDLDINAGWPSRDHLQLIVEHGPSPCHRASCFPFKSRGGRRMAYHPHRFAYRQVQGALRHAAATVSVQGDGEDWTRYSGTASRRERQRRRARRPRAVRTDGQHADGDASYDAAHTDGSRALYGTALEGFVEGVEGDQRQSSRELTDLDQDARCRARDERYTAFYIRALKASQNDENVP